MECDGTKEWINRKIIEYQKNRLRIEASENDIECLLDYLSFNYFPHTTSKRQYAGMTYLLVGILISNL